MEDLEEDESSQESEKDKCNEKHELNYWDNQLQFISISQHFILKYPLAIVPSRFVSPVFEVSTPPPDFI